MRDLTHTNLIQTIGGMPITFALIMLIAKMVVNKFQPQSPRNTWGNALLFAVIIVSAQIITAFLYFDRFARAGILTLAVTVVLFAIQGGAFILVYGVSIGLGIMMSIAALAIALGAGIAIRISPIFGLLGILLVGGIALSVSKRHRDRQRRMDEIR